MPNLIILPQISAKPTLQVSKGETTSQPYRCQLKVLVFQAALIFQVASVPSLSLTNNSPMLARNQTLRRVRPLHHVHRTITKMMRTFLMMVSSPKESQSRRKRKRTMGHLQEMAKMYSRKPKMSTKRCRTRTGNKRIHSIRACNHLRLIITIHS